MIQRSLVLRVGVDAVFHTVLLLSVYLLLAGHNAPGGGFVGGLVAGAAFVLRWAAEGPAAMRAAARVAPEGLFGAGILVSALTGIVPAVAGGAFLESRTWTADLPVLGSAKLSSTLFFDVGVYLVVVGIVLMILGILGDEEDPEDRRADGTGAPDGTGTAP